MNKTGGRHNTSVLLPKLAVHKPPVANKHRHAPNRHPKKPSPFQELLKETYAFDKQQYGVNLHKRIDKDIRTIADLFHKVPYLNTRMTKAHIQNYFNTRLSSLSKTGGSQKSQNTTPRSSRSSSFSDISNESDLLYLNDIEQTELNTEMSKTLNELSNYVMITNEQGRVTGLELNEDYAEQIQYSIFLLLVKRLHSMVNEASHTFSFVEFQNLNDKTPAKKKAKELYAVLIAPYIQRFIDTHNQIQILQQGVIEEEDEQDEVEEEEDQGGPRNVKIVSLLGFVLFLYMLTYIALADKCNIQTIVAIMIAIFSFFPLSILVYRIVRQQQPLTQTPHVIRLHPTLIEELPIPDIENQLGSEEMNVTHSETMGGATLSRKKCLKSKRQRRRTVRKYKK